MSDLQKETTQIHGRTYDRARDGASVFPIVQSSAFEHETAEDLQDVFCQRKFGYIYSRISNPT